MTQQKMTWQEVISETDWLLEGQVSPLMLPQLLGRTWQALEGLYRKHGRKDLAHMIRLAFAREQWKREKANPRRMRRDRSGRRRGVAA